MKKIFIAQSGQTWNRYANGDNEANVCGQITKALTEHLAKNYEVEIHRNNPKQGLNDYTNQANRAGCHAYYSIHTNAGGGVGAEAWVQAGKNKGRITIERSNQMGMALLNALVKDLGRRSRGIKTRLNSLGTDYFAELRQPNMPSTLVEVEFHDTAAGADWLVNNVAAIGIALAKAIAGFEGLPGKKPAVVRPNAPSNSRKFKVGDKVTVTGVLYVDSFGSRAGSRVNKLVTTIGIVSPNMGATRPYNVGNKMGWVAESDIKKVAVTPGTLRVGSKVKIKAGVARYLTGQVIPRAIKARVHTVKQIGTAKYPSGVLLDGIMSWVKRSDIDIV